MLGCTKVHRYYSFISPNAKAGYDSGSPFLALGVGGVTLN